MDRRFLSETIDHIWSNFSDLALSLMVNIKHSSMFYVSPQYHLVCSDFETNLSSGNDTQLHCACNQLIDFDSDIRYHKNSSPWITLLLFFHLILMDSDRVDLSTMLVVVSFTNVIVLLKPVIKSSGLIKPLMTPQPTSKFDWAV